MSSSCAAWSISSESLSEARWSDLIEDEADLVFDERSSSKASSTKEQRQKHAAPPGVWQSTSRESSARAAGVWFGSGPDSTDEIFDNPFEPPPESPQPRRASWVPLSRMSPQSRPSWTPPQEHRGSFSGSSASTPVVGFVPVQIFNVLPRGNMSNPPPGNFSGNVSSPAHSNMSSPVLRNDVKPLQSKGVLSLKTDKNSKKYREIPQSLGDCLCSLRQAGMLSAPMVASLALQFLPILLQRATKKQERLNHFGIWQRTVLLPLLSRLLAALDGHNGVDTARFLLHAFVSGRDTATLGDGCQTLLHTLVAQPKNKAAQVLQSASGALLDFVAEVVLPHPRGDFPPISVHHGFGCSACGANPIWGPRFHNSDDGSVLCGDCYINFAFDAECYLSAEASGSSEVDKASTGSAPKAQKAHKQVALRDAEDDASALAVVPAGVPRRDAYAVRF